jgi:hypothetical protein
MKRLSLRQVIAIFTLFTCFITQAQNSPFFQTTANSADLITPIGGQHVFGIGFYAESTYPLSSAYSALLPSGAQQDMRFQVPVGFGFEGSFGINSSMEVAASFGYDNFKTQQYIDGDGNSKKFNIAQYNLYPIMGIFRYRMPRKSWAPEAEAAIGTALGSIEIRETSINGETIKSNGPFMRGHLAGGFGFSWAENASLHFLVGYGFNQLGSKSYDGATMHVEQKNQHGVFSKAYLKFYF